MAMDLTYMLLTAEMVLAFATPSVSSHPHPTYHSPNSPISFVQCTCKASE
eukprot:m.7036 g.7036  ORF g.7036 m.7036 type:complete len:50 (+) comp5212_c0_seq1:448-597(+)